jgi:hypothetical protein
MRALSIALALLTACPTPDGTDTDTPTGEPPDLYCPGDPSGACDPRPGAPLLAAAAVRDIVPVCYEAWTDLDGNASYSKQREVFLDCGCDRLCPGDVGYPGSDQGEGDGVFQASWIGGFQNARAATGVRGADLGLRGEGDGLSARALVLQQGETTLAIVAFDAIGIMYDDTLRLREAVRAAGHEVDHVLVHSTHVHEAPDLMGIWGPTLTDTGYDPLYASQVEAAAVEAIGEALTQLTEVELSIGVIDATERWDNGIANLIRDTRDPVVVDPRVRTAQFTRTDNGATVATMVHWANHPETVADRNTLFTADYVHALRQTVESGVKWGEQPARAGVGGVCLFLNGTVGGMMTSLGAAVLDPLGRTWQEASFEKADAVGQIIGELALDAMADATPATSTDLGVKVDTLYLPVDNIAFQAMFLIDVIGHRSIHNYDTEQPLSTENVPEVLTEVDVLDVGPLRMVTLPGEPLPELFLGGYDGAWTPPGSTLIDPNNPLPPDLTLAPPGPYLGEQLGADGAWVIGLGNDEVGYLIPEYDFVVADAGAYVFEAEGDHYEETNSLGPKTAGLLERALLDLIAWGQ